MAYKDSQVALEQIKSNYDFSYNLAVKHYRDLKEKMFNQIRLNSEFNNLASDELVKLFDYEDEKLKNEIQKNITSLSNDSLETIKEWAAEDIKDSGLLAQINELDQLIHQEQNKNKTIIKRKQKEIQQRNNTRESIEALAYRMLKTNQLELDYNLCFNFLQSAYINLLRYQMRTEGQAYINDNMRTTLMGYYKEYIEAKLLKESMLKTTKNIIEIEQIGSKQNPSDIEIKINLPSSASVQEEVSVFGAQVKMKDINKVGTAFMKISTRKNLSSKFNKVMGNFDKNSWVSGVAFLGQLNNIKTALGENNVLFISGNNRYFMDEFIQNFRRQNMYLAFKFKDNPYEATSQIGLQRYKDSKGKNLLKRFI